MDRSAALALLPPADPAAVAALKSAARDDDREFDSCVGKQLFADAAAAEAQAIWVNKTDPGVTHYKCRFCNGWHVGNRAARKRRIGVRK